MKKMNEEKTNFWGLDLGIKTWTLKVHVEFKDEVLGSASANPELHRDFIASKAPDAMKMEEEIEAIGEEGVFEKGMTVFPRNDDGDPIAWDYQWKGYLKDNCKALKKVPGTVSSGMKAYKQEIDKLVFVGPRMIPYKFDGEIGICQRPLRAQTAQGERVALASSESIPAGATMDFEVLILKKELVPFVKEVLKYGIVAGFGQWRNSGKGRFVCQVEEAEENNA